VEKRLILSGIVEEVIGVDVDPRTKIKKELIRVFSQCREETIREESACPSCAKKLSYPKIIVEFRDELNSQDEARASPRLFYFVNLSISVITF